MTYYSRLESRQNRFKKRQIVFIVLVSIGLIFVIFYFGITFLFGLTSKISSLARQGQKSTIQSDPGLAPNSPTLSQDYPATSSANIKISGVADPKTSVEMFQNRQSIGTQVSSEKGTFTFDVSLEKGDNVFSAQAISDKGKKSELSDPYSVRFITGSPKLDVNTPADGDSVKDSPITISGKTDLGNTIAVNDHLVVVSDDGSFSYSLNLNDGDNKILLIAKDPAGNQTKKELTVKFSK